MKINHNINALYIHIPFCSNICHYCCFIKGLYNKRKVDLWLDNLLLDLDNYCINKQLNTIYIGGGTPTCLSISQLDRLLYSLKDYTYNLKEYTIETNIENINRELLELLVKYNINRISIGVQSINNHILKIMNRKHTKDMVINKLELVSKYISNISIDIIYGFKEISIDDYLSDLRLLLDLNLIKHISLYSLTIENNTYLSKINYQTITNELEEEFYFKSIKIFKEYGLIQYEIANFAVVGFQAIHNKYYWRYDDFYGLGYGASGKIGNQRYNILKDNIEYIDLSDNDMIFEYIMMNLRLVKGFSINDINTKYNINILDIYYKEFNELINDKLLIIEHDNIRCTLKGLYILNDVLVRLIKD